jgi:1-pyrroline-5-carboxylate dehydrogenase
MLPFKNETYLDFNDERTVHAFQQALANVEAQLGRVYPCIVGGEKIETGDLLTSVNPSKFSQVIGKVHKADQELAGRALNDATAAFDRWKRVPAEERARYLFKGAAELRRRKNEFSAWLVYEIGKSWAEADADTAEAIDFMEFYGREAIRHSQPLGVTDSPLLNEINEAFYIPLGVGIIVPPWNFPLAILAGMTMAAVVTGNTVILKPSSDTPVIAAKFMEILEAISLPAGVVNFLPGSGSRIGDFLIGHPKTRFICFTGSREVGLHINELAAKTAPGQKWIKRVVAEMGGKDTIIVDSSANLDEAASNCRGCL